jgi:putative transposase
MKRGKLDSIAGNILDRNFGADMPNLPWLSDITYVRTYEAFLSVAAVIDPFFAAHSYLGDG